MNPALPLTRDLLLIGGGHAHALVLRAWGMDPLPGVRVTLVNPGPTAPYTGMLPGHVAGHYGRCDLDIDLVRLCRFAGARLIDGAVTALDLDAREAVVEGRGPIAWDVASIDVGIHSEMPELPGFAEHAVGAKPLDSFARAWRAWRDRASAGDVAPEAAVIGGGVAGVELAMAMAYALRDRDPRVTVLERADGITGTEAAPRLHRAMRDLGVTFRGGVEVARVKAGAVVLGCGTRVPAGFVTGATGGRPHRWITAQDLPLEDGFVRVGPDLRVEGHADLFAAGDCAHLAHAPRPKAGVYAVRAAKVLHGNLRAALSGGRTAPYRPQRRYLKLISLGGKDAVAERGGWHVSHPWLWRWKDRIDRAFMERLTDLPRMGAFNMPRNVAEGVVEAMQGGKPVCAGCGSKVSGDALASVLARLPATGRADILSRPGDDAAVLSVGGAKQVVTTDHLRAFTEDPVLFARIATVHALGDVWAMGAAPQAALLTTVLPRMSETLQARTLREVTEAVAGVLAEAGAELVGGHSMMGAEMSLGLSVTGLLEGRATGIDGARPGDALLLTKPLGTGLVLAAEMAGAARGGDVTATLAAMARPQGEAARMLAPVATAMTDVTGFGLAGHLSNFCRASGVGAEIDMDALQAHPGALEAAEAGHLSTLAPANARSAPVAGASGPRAALLHDPQTAGGFLAAVPEGEAERLRQAAGAVRIGRIVAGAGLRVS
jgi:selenide,water dikinase